MTSSTLVSPSRRSFLQYTATAAVIGTGIGSWILYQWPSSQLLEGFKVLRKDDLAFLQAVTPVILAGSYGTGKVITAEQITTFLYELDYKLEHLSPAKQQLLFQLFDAMAVTLARGPLTNVWRGWDKADQASIENALQRLEFNPLALLRMGYASTCQVFALTHYCNPQTWSVCGYPGPPQI